MSSFRTHLPVSFLSLCVGTVAMLGVVYIALIAVVMSYAALTVEFSQSVKSDEAALAMLESEYLSGVARVQSVDYHSLGYVAPVAKSFVPAATMTALR